MKEVVIMWGSGDDDVRYGLFEEENPGADLLWFNGPELSMGSTAVMHKKGQVWGDWWHGRYANPSRHMDPFYDDGQKRFLTNWEPTGQHRTLFF